MAKQKKSYTSKKNAQLSTGPRSMMGKTIVKSNGISHGLSSQLPVIRDEKSEDWEAHRLGIIASIAPGGQLETELAERVALLTWRLRRVVRYETEVMAGPSPILERKEARTAESVDREHQVAWENRNEVLRLKEHYEKLQTHRDEIKFEGPSAHRILLHALKNSPLGNFLDLNVADPAFLNAIGVPEECSLSLSSWSGWTRKILMNGLGAIGQKCGLTAEGLLEYALNETKKAATFYASEMRRLEDESAILKRNVRRLAEEEEPEESGFLMGRTALDKVIRYENHLSRQLLLSLDELRCQQFHRLRSLQAESSDEGLPTLEAGSENGSLPIQGAVMVEAQG